MMYVTKIRASDKTFVLRRAKYHVATAEIESTATKHPTAKPISMPSPIGPYFASVSMLTTTKQPLRMQMLWRMAWKWDLASHSP